MDQTRVSDIRDHVTQTLLFESGIRQDYRIYDKTIDILNLFLYILNSMKIIMRETDGK